VRVVVVVVVVVAGNVEFNKVVANGNLFLRNLVVGVGLPAEN